MRERFVYNMSLLHPSRCLQDHQFLFSFLKDWCHWNWCNFWPSPFKKQTNKKPTPPPPNKTFKFSLSRNVYVFTILQICFFYLIPASTKVVPTLLCSKMGKTVTVVKHRPSRISLPNGLQKHLKSHDFLHRKISDTVAFRDINRTKYPEKLLQL